MNSKNTIEIIAGNVGENFGNTAAASYRTSVGAGELTFGKSLEACQNAVNSAIRGGPHPDPGKTTSRGIRVRVKRKA
jgi:hypothetical protein